MRYYITLILIIQSFGLYSQSIKWYMPWENDINNLVEDNLLAVPLNVDGYAYRILKVSPVSGSIIKNIKITSANTSSEIFFLPIDKAEKLDVLIPYSSRVFYRGESLFLVKFKGLKSGINNVQLNIEFNKETKEYFRTINTSSIKLAKRLNSNVWAYLGYNYLLKNLNNEVVKDLENHNINFIVIPGYVQPSLDLKERDIARLDTYLKTLGNSFDYYCIYLNGFQGKKSIILSDSWKKRFPVWFIEIQKVFNRNNIPTSKILLYPFDEPSDENIRKASIFAKFLKSKNIKTKTYITLHQAGSEHLALQYDFVQVHIREDDLLKKILALGKDSKMVLNYETNVAREDSHPTRYLALPLKAIKYNLGGYGMWNYSDAKKTDLTEFHKGKGSWEFTTSTRGDFYNSLIHRKQNHLYSSLRWEAFSSGQDEFYWIERLAKSKGTDLRKSVLQNLLDKSILFKDWEKLKLSLNEN